MKIGLRLGVIAALFGVMPSIASLTPTIENILCSADMVLLSQRLAQGFDVNQILPSGRTPLTFIHSNPSCRFDAALVEILVSAGADVNKKDELGNPPIVVAAGMGPVSSVALFLAQNADPNATDAKGYTSLMVLGDDGRSSLIDTARLLIDAGADVNKVALDGMTAYRSAANAGRVQLAEYLKSRGADAHI